MVAGSTHRIEQSEREPSGYQGMERSMTNLFDQAKEFLPMIGVACLGAVLQCFHGKWQGWKNFFISVATAGFGACLVGVLFRGMGISEDIAFFFSGMIGYSGGRLVDNMLDVTTCRLTNECHDLNIEHRSEHNNK